MSSIRVRFLLHLSWNLLFLAACLIIAPLIGSAEIDLGRALATPFSENLSPDHAILFGARIPRILLAAIAGAALAVSGVTFQALLRNPLATPYTLGVSSGASFGAVLAMVLGLNTVIPGVPFLEITAFASALGTIYLVYRLSVRSGRSNTHVMLLAGVTISFFFAAMIMFLQYISDFTQTYQILHWLMGGLDVAGYDVIIRILPIVLTGLIVLLLISHNFNLLSAGEDTALSRGVNVALTRKIAYGAASLITAAVVSAAGPIGFVGLIVPHGMRLITGSDHRILLPCSAISGAGFLILCDTLARTIFAPTELPIGVLTAMLGGPFFLILLFKSEKTF